MKLKLAHKIIVVEEREGPLYPNGPADKKARGWWDEEDDGVIIIVLDSKMPNTEKAETLLHELFHIIGWFTGRDLDEGGVEAFTNTFTTLFRQNSILKDLLWPKKDEKFGR